MNEKTLRRWYESRRAEYENLAAKCASVPELMLRIEVLGERWTAWDWALFMSYIDFGDETEACGEPVWRSSAETDALDDRPRSLTADMLDTVSGGTALNQVASSKTVVLSFVSLAELRPATAGSSYRFLARAFWKFPAMWRMNWMFVRHKDGSRTHRLECALPDIRRPRSYYESDAFRTDFVSRYWGYSDVRWRS